MKAKDIKQQLKRTWRVFFGRFGRLTEIQTKAIPKVLEGKNLVIMSPTATGKTEAVLAPLLEILLEQMDNNSGKDAVLVLYVTPTRALVNDMYYRLKDQLEQLGLRVGRRTGDHPYINPKKPPHILITTPESLDSIICRHQNLLDHIQALIIDEIHLIDNTYRGDQLRILIRRLKRKTKNKFKIFVLSATIVDPEDIGRRYIEDKFDYVIAGGKREIVETIVSSLEEVYNISIREKLRKILIFCNTRKNVEIVALEAKKLWGEKNVVAHHGSLKRAVRETAEIFMKEHRVGVCVATSTLEIGIDIGDIDAIVLADVPPSITSLIQRIGRGNRRSNKIRLIAIAKTEEEDTMLRQMINLAKKHILAVYTYTPDLSVVVQQTFSILYEKRSGVDIHYLQELFKGFCTSEELDLILNNLADKNWIIIHNEKIYPTEKLINLGDRGKIHSNIPESKVLKVIDADSGTEIGEVSGTIGEIFVLAGKTWQVVSIHDDKIYAKRTKEKTDGDVIFENRHQYGVFYRYLPAELKAPAISKTMLIRVEKSPIALHNQLQKAVNLSVNQEIIKQLRELAKKVLRTLFFFVTLIFSL